MPVTPSANSWQSNSLYAVETLLCNCAMFRTLLGAADVAAARLKCYWQDVAQETTAPYALIRLGQGSEDESVALNTPMHADEVMVRIVWAEQRVSGDTDKEAGMREVNSFGDLLTQIRALVGTGSYVSRCRRTYETPARMADDSNDRNCWDATITFTWEI